MGFIARFKRDIVRHRGKSAVLLALFATMVVFSAKAVIELRPPQARAAIPTGQSKAEAALPMSSAEAEARIAESKRLWQTLRDVKPGAANAAVAFAFDASYYPPPPPDPTKHAAATEPEPVKATAPVAPPVDLEAIRQAQIRDQSRGLIVKTTAVGNSGTKPMAIINQQLLTIGQQILGFEITAIRAREVEFVKEGVVVVVKMPVGQ
jgi:hypothetical protein